MIKRRVSLFVPFQKKEGDLFVFLQKRSMDMVRIPGYWGLFGGGLDGEETFEQALYREVKEELDYTPKHLQVFDHRIYINVEKEIFLEEVDDSFEKHIEVLEGEFGQWFRIQDALQLEPFLEADKIVLQDISKKFV